MREAVASMSDEKEDLTGLVGCCYAMTSRADPHLLGYVFLSKDRLGAGLVSHELSHAALRALERRGLKLRHWHTRDTMSMRDRQHSVEETFCNYVEALSVQFWQEAYRLRFASPES